MAAGDRSILCSDQQSNGQIVDYNLCVWPTRDWSNNGKVYSNITATFTNYGIPLCRLAFYITNIGENIHVSPSWLPDTSKAYPEGIPRGTEIIIEATVPWTNTIAMKGAAVIDVQGGWTTCSEEIALSESKNVPATSAVRFYFALFPLLLFLMYHKHSTKYIHSKNHLQLFVTCTPGLGWSSKNVVGSNGLDVGLAALAKELKELCFRNRWDT